MTDSFAELAASPAPSYAEQDTHFTFQQAHERPLIGLCGYVADPTQEVNARPSGGGWPTCVVCFDLLRGIRP